MFLLYKCHQDTVTKSQATKSQLTESQLPSPQGQDSQRFAFFVNYEWAQKLVRYITVGWKKRVSDKQSSLLDPLVSYTENKVL
jgi:hypothetical protein